jgi:hypothetical protein
MSRTIWKYPLEILDKQRIRVPLIHEVLAVQMQAGAPQLWVLVDPDMPQVDLVVAIYGTGNPVDSGNDDKYVGSFQQAGGALVWHVFALHPRSMAGSAWKYSSTNSKETA